ncbi:MAG: copper resistance protein B [Sphingomonadales bacterium]|nr:copper resistance protein B [Sphingomonadales bacterium]MDE2568761.1 copper resistance protein B [Sphingomonadales bacterium]
MSGMQMPGMESSQPVPEAPDKMQGMDMPGHPVMDHAMHAMPKEPAKPVPHMPPPPAALSGPAHAADAYYPDGEMTHARTMMTGEMGGIHTTLVMLDRLEAQTGKGGDGWAWEGGLRTGGDIDKLWLKTEGEGGIGGGVEDAEAQALWSHAIGPWFDLQAGVRHQFLTGPDRTQLAVGVEGLAPYMFDVSAAAFVSSQGEFTARISVAVDQRLTQRLILQPRIEANLSAQDVPAIGLGSGVTSLRPGLRLRYEIRREFAPYVGVEWQKQFGRTASMTRGSGGNADRIIALVGLRVWF